MSEQTGINYITSGRRWARGWNRFEAETMRWLFGILIVSVFLGVVLGAIAVVFLSPPLWLSLVLVLALIILMLLVGIGLAKAVIPFIWDVKLSKHLESAD